MEEIVMANKEKEIWRAYPEIPGIEVSTLGNVRTLDKLVSSEKYTRFFKGRILKPYNDKGGYLQVSVKIDGKFIKKLVHRLVAQTFIPNPDSLPEINHKDGNRANNNASNLEWCNASYNNQYREKFGESAGHPVFAISLDTLEVSRFRSQIEASRVLGIFHQSINAVIKGRKKNAGGYWFVNDDDKTDDAIKHKLHDIKKV